MSSMRQPETVVETPVQQKKYDHEYAGDIDKNEDETAGKNFDDATNELATKDDAEITFGDNLKKGDTAGYKKAVSDLGKSYGALLDANNDGKVTVQEYMNHELNGSTDSDMVKAAKIASSKIDLNNDGYIDSKELAATVAFMDSNSEGKVDGKIDADSYKKTSINLADGTETSTKTKINKMYEWLFPSKSEE